MRIAFIGVGKLGLPCAEEIAKKGHTVTGYDISGFESGLVEKKDSIKDLIHYGYQDDNCPDIVFIAVPTPHEKEYDGRYPTAHLEPKDFDYSIVKEVLTEVERYANNTTLVVLISTVLPGTVRREFIDLMPRMKHRFVYNPYLIAMGTVGWDMINPEMVMIGTKDGDETTDAKELIDFYKTIMENDPRYIVGTWDECECIKIFYNTFISTKVSLVNMIQDVAERQGNIDVDVVTKALADSTHRIMSPMYMKAGMGDGGACVKPDFKVTVNDEVVSISDLYEKFDENEYYIVDSMNWSGTNTDQKKIAEVTKREYTGKLYTFTTSSGKSISVTEDHLIPIERDRKRIIIPAKEVKNTDKMFVFG